jgi:hypothetical protein
MRPTGLLVSRPLAHRWYLPTCPVLGDLKVWDVTSFEPPSELSASGAATAGDMPTTAAAKTATTRPSAVAKRCHEDRGELGRPF